MKKILALFSVALTLAVMSCTNENKRKDEVTVDKRSVNGTPVTVTTEGDKGTVVVPVPPPPPAPQRPPTPKEVIKGLPKPPLPPPPPAPPLPRKGG
ncbi:MAG TPA: hypothetical protein VHL77_12055 [Ferruginibacter sp.]|nr:hypothetical protein [Ferruginibacter sp.]